LRGAEDKPSDTDPQTGRSGAQEQRGSVDDDSAGSDSLARAQAASDRDLAPSANDQTASDSDQAASDRDQGASDADQVASDRESAAGADQQVRDMGRVHRRHATQLRDEESRARLRTAVSREITADERDEVASERDQIADMRDASAKAREDTVESPGPVRRGKRVSRAARDRQRAADDRATAADDRAAAAQERARSAHDRTLAAHDRAQAALDRRASETDELTHVRRRGPGIEQLQREVDRAHRTPEKLVVTFIDVDGLKQVNDTKGHLAGDALLVAVANTLQTCLRSYDLIMRFGGDEFVCALPNADIKKVRQRFAEVSNVLATGPVTGSIAVGFAELGEDDSAEDLIRRADADLLAQRERS